MIFISWILWNGWFHWSRPVSPKPIHPGRLCIPSGRIISPSGRNTSPPWRNNYSFSRMDQTVITWADYSSSRADYLFRRSGLLFRLGSLSIARDVLLYRPGRLTGRLVWLGHYNKLSKGYNLSDYEDIRMPRYEQKYAIAGIYLCHILHRWNNILFVVQTKYGSATCPV